MNPRIPRRNQLFALGVIPAVLVLLVLLDVVLQLRANHEGRSAYDDKAYADAEEAFLDAAGVDLPEGWVAPFNAGAAAYQDGQYADAAAHFDAALDDVPDDRECTVRVNLALTHEALGDQLRKQGKPQQSVEEFHVGRDVLDAGGCADGEGQSVDDRLAARILAADRSPNDPNAELTPEEKLARLEERNERAGEDKRREQDDVDPTKEPDTPIQW
jgi:tetratricopeptide (TPR) repeat protein